MTKAEMIEFLATSNEVSKATAKGMLDGLINIIGEQVRKEGRCAVPGLGTFTVSKRAARTGRNPATGETIKIKASKVARFKPAPALKEAASKFKG
jgi:DNA-binding protein HU-beta